MNDKIMITEELEATYLVEDGQTIPMESDTQNDLMACFAYECHESWGGFYKIDKFDFIYRYVNDKLTEYIIKATVTHPKDEN